MVPEVPTQRAPDGRQDVVHVLQYLIVPEAQDVKTASFEDRGALRVVVLLVRVPAAIQFDDQLGIDAHEIGDVAVDWELAAELEAVEVASPKAAPELALRFGLSGP